MNALTLQLLGKDIYSISDEDLVSFFSIEQEETALLEFKSGEVKLEDVYKEVAAFANTEGGVLVIGAPRERDVQRGLEKVKVCFGELTTSSFRGKDWLTQKLASQVIPLPVGIKVQEITVVDGRRFVIEVPQSLSPPHQVAERGIYYIRLDREARPAPHAFVQALFNKRRVPLLSAQITLKTREEDTDAVTVLVVNESRFPADRVGMIVSVWNVDDVECDLRLEKDASQLVDRWTRSMRSDQVLVNPLAMPTNMLIRHRRQPYFVSIGYWSIDCEYQQNYWVCNPLKEGFSLAGNIDTYKEALDNFMDQTILLNQ